MSEAKKEKRLDEMSIAFENDVEASPNLWRVVFWRDIVGRRLRCTTYFGSEHECQEFIGLHQDDVIMVREYQLVCEGEA